MRIKRQATVDPSDKCWACESPLTESAWLVEESEGRGEPIHTIWLGCEDCTRFIYVEEQLSLYVDTGEEFVPIPLEYITRLAVVVANVKDVPRNDQRVFLTVNDRRIELPRWTDETRPLIVDEC